MKAETATYFIGIDPGTYTGFAVWVPKSATGIDGVEPLLSLEKKHTYRSALKRVSEFPVDDTIVVIEDPGQNKPIWHDKDLPPAVREKIAKDVGGNHMEARILADYIEALGYRVKRVRPTTEKLEHFEFRRITGYQGQTNEHVRDAAMLVFGIKSVVM